MPDARFLVSRAYGALRRGRYLTALALFQQAEALFPGSPEVESLAMWASNSTGLKRQPARVLSVHREPGVTAKRDRQYRPDPLEALIEALKAHRIVIFMEDHGCPEHRLVGARLIELLAAAGATHLAWETNFQAGLDVLMVTGRCRPGTEVFGFDPGRANLLRCAQACGLQIVAFDMDIRDHFAIAPRRGLPDATNRFREERMALHIKERILDRDPDARVVVWTGHQHALKACPPGLALPGPFMAQHLWRMTGLEPYCIYQCSATTWDMGIYHWCLEHLPLDQLRGPILLRSSQDGCPAELEHRIRELGVDAVIVHPGGPGVSGVTGTGSALPHTGVIAGAVVRDGVPQIGCLVQAVAIRDRFLDSLSARFKRAAQLWGISPRAVRALVLAYLNEAAGVDETPVAQGLTGDDGCACDSLPAPIWYASGLQGPVNVSWSAPNRLQS